eukprot:s713_g3.t1
MGSPRKPYQAVTVSKRFLRTMLQKYGIFVVVGLMESGAQPSQGLNLAAFSRLVDDKGDQGAYCSDDELRDMLQVGPPQPQPAPVQVPARPPPGLEAPDRRQLKESVFSMFDLDRDGCLGREELWGFARSSPNFDCDEEDWGEVFAELCDDYACDPGEGLSKEAFLTLVDDESEQGCYCTENELQAMLRQGPPAPRPTGKGKDSSKAQGKKGAKGGQQADEGFDPWSTPEAQRFREKGNEKGAKGKGKAKSAQEEEDFDPWATPQAQKAREKMQQKAKEENEEVWGKWREAGKPGIGLDPAAPAMDKKKLLEAVAARKKAAEAKKLEEQATTPESMPEEERPPPPPVPPVEEEDEDEMFWSTKGTTMAPAASSSRAAASSTPAPPARRAVSMSAALAGIGAAVAQLAMGDKNAVEELAAQISGAPCVPHAAAVASSASSRQSRLLLREIWAWLLYGSEVREF